MFAGTINLGPALRLRVRAVGEGTLLAEIVRLMELAEQRRSRFVAIADRVARAYAPVVHSLALLTFLGWTLSGAALADGAALRRRGADHHLPLRARAGGAGGAGAGQRPAAAPGTLLKSATALERFARADMVVFDKTGTLTAGRLELAPTAVDPATLAAAAGMARASRHPLARALAAAAPSAGAAPASRRSPAAACAWPGPRASGGWAGATGPPAWPRTMPSGPSCGWRGRAWRRCGSPSSIACARTPPRWSASCSGAAMRVALLSGDREPTVRRIAGELGIADWQAGCTPDGKTARLEAWAAEGRRVLMVGDGLNDAPALAAAYVSLSPASAVDIAQTAADAVFQGDRLAPVLRGDRRRPAAERLVQAELRAVVRLQSAGGAVRGPGLRDAARSRRSPCRAARSWSCSTRCA